jgi:hypothetical protein
LVLVLGFEDGLFECLSGHGYLFSRYDTMGTVDSLLPARTGYAPR